MGKRRTMADGRPLLDEWNGILRYAFAAPACLTGLRLSWHRIPGGRGLFQTVQPAKHTRRARRRARGRRVLLSKALFSGSEWGGQALKALERAEGSPIIRVRW